MEVGKTQRRAQSEEPEAAQDRRQAVAVANSSQSPHGGPRLRQWQALPAATENKTLQPLVFGLHKRRERVAIRA
jgi:hypothetical protein